jgi:hypothetical protein
MAEKDREVQERYKQELARYKKQVEERAKKEETKKAA